jgi:membrane protein implicated in regulation of membrane protease activity
MCIKKRFNEDKRTYVVTDTESEISGKKFSLIKVFFGYRYLVEYDNTCWIVYSLEEASE